MLAVHILMQRIEVALAVLEQKWCRPRLPRVVAPRDQVRVCIGITCRDAHRRVPTVRDRNQAWIERRTEGGDRVGQWVREVLVLAASEAMPCHDDVASERTVVRVEGGNRGTLARGEEFG